MIDGRERGFDYRDFLRLVRDMRDAQRRADIVCSPYNNGRRQRLEASVDGILRDLLSPRQGALPGLWRGGRG